MGDPLKIFAVHLGNETINVAMTHKAYSMAKQRIATKNKFLPKMQELFEAWDRDIAAEFFSAMAIAGHKGQVPRPDLTPDAVGKILDDHPRHEPPLIAATLQALSASYGRMNPEAVEAEAKGEAQAGTSPAASGTDGQT
jgi:hypothetical protein